MKNKLKKEKESSKIKVIVNSPNPDLVIEKLAQLMPLIVSNIIKREFEKKL